MTKGLARLQTYGIRTRHGERGATAVEYGLIIGLVAAVIILTVTTTGIKVLGMFTSVNWWLP